MDVAYIGVLRTGVPTSCRTVLSFFWHVSLGIKSFLTHVTCLVWGYWGWGKLETKLLRIEEIET
jgi:hypothetical protein